MSEKGGFAALLCEYREERDRSRNNLAYEVGVDSSYLSRIESGERAAPRQHIIDALARALNLSRAKHARLLVAADNCTAAKITHQQMEAIVFHELNHCGLDEKERPMVRPHDFEGFAAEIVEYGFWKSDIKAMARAFEQGQLFEQESNRSRELDAMARARSVSSIAVEDVAREVVRRINGEVQVSGWMGGPNDRPVDDGQEADDAEVAAQIAAARVPVAPNGRGVE